MSCETIDGGERTIGGEVDAFVHDVERDVVEVGGRRRGLIEALLDLAELGRVEPAVGRSVVDQGDGRVVARRRGEV